MKALLATLISAACCTAQAGTAFQDVPSTLQDALRGNAIHAAQLQQGVLRLQMDKPEVTELVYATFVFHAICREQWVNPASFAQWRLSRVELLNTDGKQGYAFDARGDTCEKMGPMGKNYRHFIAERTQPCPGGTCPPAR